MSVSKMTFKASVPAAALAGKEQTQSNPDTRQQNRPRHVGAMPGASRIAQVLGNRCRIFIGKFDFASCALSVQTCLCSPRAWTNGAATRPRHGENGQH